MGACHQVMLLYLSAEDQTPILLMAPTSTSLIALLLQSLAVFFFFLCVYECDTKGELNPNQIHSVHGKILTCRSFHEMMLLRMYDVVFRLLSMKEYIEINLNLWNIHQSYVFCHIRSALNGHL